MLQEVFHVDDGPVTLSVPATLSPEKMWWIGLGFSCASLSDGQMPKQPAVALAFRKKEAANWGDLTDRPTHSGNRANVARAVVAQAVLSRAEPEAVLLFPHGLRCCRLN
jgi:hypothetical protein